MQMSGKYHVVKHDSGEHGQALTVKHGPVKHASVEEEKALQQCMNPPHLSVCTLAMPSVYVICIRTFL